MADVLPQLSLETSGSNRPLTVRDPISGVEVPLGEVEGGVFLPSAPDPAQQALTVYPVGNTSVATRASYSYQATTQHESLRTFVNIRTLVNNKGSTQSLGAESGNRVVDYLCLSQRVGAGDGWIINSVMSVEAGAPQRNIQTYEGDHDVQNAHYGETAGPSGLAQPIAYGFNLTGAGAKRLTAAYIASSAGGQLWNRGFGAGITGVVQETFFDYGTATRTLGDWGSHVTGVDLGRGTYSQAAIVLPATGIVQGRDSGGTYRELMRHDAGNFYIGSPAIAGVITRSNFQPASDNTFSLGISGGRFSSVWAANGTIQTSDPAQKTDMRSIDPALAMQLVQMIDPITFKWLVGGYEEVEEDTEVEVIATEMAPVMVEDIVMVDGVAVLQPRTIMEQREIWDEFEVHDAEGKPVMVEIAARAEVLDRNGRVVGPAREGRMMPRLYRKPRMVMQPGKVKRLVAQPGNRTHWGWNARQIQLAFEAVEKDFGGFVIAADGSLALRPDQMIPILWAALKGVMAGIVPPPLPIGWEVERD